jgi:hypothetical protein
MVRPGPLRLVLQAIFFTISWVTFILLALQPNPKRGSCPCSADRAIILVCSSCDLWYSCSSQRATSIPKASKESQDRILRTATVLDQAHATFYN